VKSTRKEDLSRRVGREKGKGNRRKRTTWENGTIDPCEEEKKESVAQSPRASSCRKVARRYPNLERPIPADQGGGKGSKRYPSTGGESSKLGGASRSRLKKLWVLAGGQGRRWGAKFGGVPGGGKREEERGERGTRNGRKRVRAGRQKNGGRPWAKKVKKPQGGGGERKRAKLLRV